jgi:hypothetical protein
MEGGNKRWTREERKMMNQNREKDETEREEEEVNWEERRMDEI